MPADVEPPPSVIPHPPTPTFRRTSNPAVPIALAILVGVIAIGMGLAFFTGLDMVAFAPFCGFFVVLVIIIVVVIAAAASGALGGSRLPPPPPIQQPMVPAGMQGPVSLSCPNCGAPPQAVDRFGVATCPYCNTRYLVR